MRELIGKQVEVDIGDIVYEGLLIEVNEDEIHLQAETGWIVVPLKKIVHVRARK